MTSKQKLFIYHEQQESALCGQHCLNNVLQGPHFTAVDLAEIANKLDEEERRLLSDHNSNNLSSYFTSSYRSHNVDDSGNFSVQVLKAALQKYNKCDLVPWHHSPNDTTGAIQQEMIDATHANNKAFIVNRSEHWFTIRKINNHWWNLNSMQMKPERISDFYLSAFLQQLRQEGYSVFLVIGNVPDHGDPELSKSYLSSQQTGIWYDEAELLALYPSGKHDNNKPTFAAFTGKGNRLGGDNNHYDTTNQVTNPEEYDEELELAKAISASLQQSQPQQQPHATPTVVVTNPKDEMRAKRLAAMAANANMNK